MPGVIGYIKPNEKEQDSSLIDLMAEALEDETHFYSKTHVEDGFGFGLVQLSTLSKTHSPVWDTENKIGLIFYGEIYNRLDLVKQLEYKGVFLDQVTDDFILLNLYLEYGEKFATFINGAFLILIWHRESKTIKIINDRMGLHPLYYGQYGQTFLLSSGIRALLVDPNISRSVDFNCDF